MSTTALVHPFRRNRRPRVRLFNAYLLNVTFESRRATGARPSVAGRASPRRSPQRAASSRSASSGRSRAGATSSASSPRAAPASRRVPLEAERSTRGVARSVAWRPPRSSALGARDRFHADVEERLVGQLLEHRLGLVVEPADEPDPAAGDLDACHVAVP